MFGKAKIHGYEIISTLGYGAHSTVYAVRDRNDQRFALKHTVVTKKEHEGAIKQATDEYDISKNFDQANLRRSHRLIRPFGLSRTRSVSTLMEYVDGYSLDDVHTSDLAGIIKWFKEIALALDAMHKLGFVHTDIKPNNVLVTRAEQTIKVIDFGQSCKVGTVKKKVQGTPDFMAPEQTNRDKITPLTDVFNLGATMYLLLTGDPLPTATGASLARAGGRKGAFITPHEADPNIPVPLSVLVMDCVKEKPADRPDSMRQVIRRLILGESRLESPGQPKRK